MRRVALELAQLDGLADALADGLFDGRTLAQVRTRGVATTRTALAVGGEFEVLAALDVELAQWLCTLDAWPDRLALIQPDHELASEAATHDVDVPELVRALATVPGFNHAAIEGVPQCLLGRAPRRAPTVLDASMLAPDGRLEIFRYARRFVQSRDRVKSLRCRSCAVTDTCEGVAVNWVRAHGLGRLLPIPVAPP